MKPSLITPIFLLLPYTILALYDESSPRKVKLEDIEDEHLQSERHAKALQPPSLPPPLSKQPAKGQPMKMYPPITSDHIAEEYHQQNPSTSHRYSTQAQHLVGPLIDQPTESEADYQQLPAYQSETIVYLPANAHGRKQQQQQQQQQQPSPVFYYSHDTEQQAQQQQSTRNGYRVQFVPIDQNEGSDEQHTYTGPKVTVAQGNGGNQGPITETPVVSYSHGSAFGAEQAEAQQQEDSVRYVTSNEIRERGNVQQVYGLPASVLFESQKDIQYAKPSNAYGLPPRTNQPTEIQYPPYPPVDNSQPAVRPSPTYGPPPSPASYFTPQKDIEYAQEVRTEIIRKPAVVYGPPDTVGQVPQIQYGVPDAPFRRPEAQSNQNAYAPRRPNTLARSNEKHFSVSFPYPPSFVSITTKRPFYEKSSSAPEPSYNEISQWQANVMPLHLIPPQDTHYRSFGTTQAILGPTPTPRPNVVSEHIETQPDPIIDFFQSRRAKSLLDSYIPSWLVARMQEEHARKQTSNYALSSPTADTAPYNTIAYSIPFEDTLLKHYKRSIQSNKRHQKKAELLTGMP